jgi:succinyl-CoA synthetase alpha subunit
MSILIDETSRVLIQGLHRRQGYVPCQEMIAYGTKVVGGVTPGKGGQAHLGLPVFNTVKEAVKQTGATHSIAFVAPAFCADAIMEAADAGIGLICSITDGIPAQDMMRVKRYLLRYSREHRTMMVGPNCAGIISPGKAMLGIMPGHIYKQGSVGIVSRSGTLGYEAASQMKALGIGITTSVGIGGDPINGSSFLDHLVLFQARSGNLRGHDDRRRNRRPPGSRGGGVDQEPHDQTGGRLCRRPHRAKEPPHGPCPARSFRQAATAPPKSGISEILRPDRGSQSERTWHHDGRGFGPLRTIPARHSPKLPIPANEPLIFSMPRQHVGQNRGMPFLVQPPAGLPMTEFGAGRPGLRPATRLEAFKQCSTARNRGHPVRVAGGVVHRQHPESRRRRGKSGPGICAGFARPVFRPWHLVPAAAIVEQHYAMRLRRQTERVRGEAAVEGTFANLIAEAANHGAAAQDLRGLLASTRIRPVITAHPTEAKRVTVLEKHRRIYRLLVELEQPRWTARERAGIIDKLRDEIALLWMTGELRLEKPSVDEEVAWGLHFFHETLFDGVPDLLRKLDRVLDQFYPGEHPALTPFFQFGSWIGGDRDGNPFVTNDVTRRALRQNALASLRHYEQHLSLLLQRMSIAERALPLPIARDTNGA